MSGVEEVFPLDSGAMEAAGGNYKMGERAFAEPIIDAGFGQRDEALHKYPIATLAGRPELIIRPWSYVVPITNRALEKPIYPYTEGDTLITDALFRLEQYGLHNPGFRMARELVGREHRQFEAPGDLYQMFYVTDRIEGIPLTPERLAELPFEVVSQAFKTIIQYEMDMRDKPGVYLEDMRLPQLVYGHSPYYNEDKLYFVDVESTPENVEDNIKSRLDSFTRIASYNGMMLTRDLRAIEAAFGEQDVLRLELGRLFIAYAEANMESARISSEDASNPASKIGQSLLDHYLSQNEHERALGIAIGHAFMSDEERRTADAVITLALAVKTADTQDPQI